jgi:hypothetical protein
MQGEMVSGVAACSEFPNDNPALHRGAIWACLSVRGAPVSERPRVEASRVEVPEAATGPEVVPALVTADGSEPNELPPQVTGDGSEPSDLLEAAPAIVGLRVITIDDAPPVVDEATAPFEAENGESFAIDDDMTFESAVDEDAVREAPFDEAPMDPFLKLVAAIETVALDLGGVQEHIAAVRALLGVTRWEGLELAAAAIEALVTGKIIVEGGSRRAHGLSRTREFTEQVLAWQAILRGESEDFSQCASLDAWAADVLSRVLSAPARADGIRRELRGRGVAAFGLIADAA